MRYEDRCESCHDWFDSIEIEGGCCEACRDELRLSRCDRCHDYIPDPGTITVSAGLGVGADEDVCDDCVTVNDAPADWRDQERIDETLKMHAG